MAAEAKLKVTADTDQAERALGGLERSLDGIKTVAGFAIAALAGKATINAIGDFIDAAADAEKNLKGVSIALARMGDTSQDSLDEISAFADELSALTGVEDDAALNAFKLAASFGVTKDQAKDMVTAATELSAATGRDLDSSVQLLGKSLDGTAGALKEISPAIRELTKEELIAGGATKALLDQFGGTAAQQLKTFSGSLASTKNAFGNLEEALGNTIVKNKAVIAAIETVGDVFRELDKLVTANKDSIGAFISGAVKAIVVSVPTAIEVIGFFTRAIQGILTVGNLAFDGLISVVETFATAWDKTFGNVIRGVLKLGETTGVISEDVRRDFDSFTGGALRNLKDFSDASTSATADTIKAFDEFNNGFGEFQKKVDEYAQKVFDADAKIVSSAKTAVEQRNDVLTGRTPVPTAPGAAAETAKGLQGGELDFNFAASFKDAAIDAGSQMAASFIANIGAGKEGARQFVAQTGGAIAEAFGGPAVGQAVTQALQLLGQDPQAFRAAIDGFIEGIPEIIDNIVENIPYLVEKIAENSGEIITALIAATPRIAIALANAMPIVAEALAKEVGEGLSYQVEKFNQAISKATDDIFLAGQNFASGVKDGINGFINDFKLAVPAIADDFKAQIASAGTQFFDSIKAAAQELVDAVTPGGGGGKSIIGTDRGPITGKKGSFLAGGGTIPSGFPNDSFAANLTSGETVVPRDDVETLRSFMAEQGNQSGVMNALLNQILAALQQPQQVSTAIEVDGTRLADVILDLNRRNARLSA